MTTLSRPSGVRLSKTWSKDGLDLGSDPDGATGYRKGAEQWVRDSTIELDHDALPQIGKPATEISSTSPASRRYSAAAVLGKT